MFQHTKVGLKHHDAYKKMSVINKIHVLNNKMMKKISSIIFSSLFKTFVFPKFCFISSPKRLNISSLKNKKALSPFYHKKYF